MKTTRLRHRLAVVAICAVALSACDRGAPVSEPAPPPAPSAPVPTEDPAGDATPVAPDRPVVAETLPYGEIGEQLVYGHFAFPDDMVDPLPGVIVIHERWGLDDGIRGQADRLAGHGYVVLAVDLYLGETATDAESARELMVTLVENQDQANENLRQAYQFLKNTAQAERIGVLGWSLGGSWAFNAAMLLPDSLDAAVIYYGQVTDNRERLEAINAPILGLFGNADRGVTPESVEAFREAMEALGKEIEVEIYPDAGHAFADPNSPNYVPEVAEAAWQRSVDFLARHLINGAN